MGSGWGDSKACYYYATICCYFHLGKCQIGKKVRNEMSRGAESKPFLSPKEQRWDSSLFSLTQMGWGCEPAWGMREAVAKKLASYPMTMSYDRYHAVRENTFKGLRS